MSFGEKWSKEPENVEECLTRLRTLLKMPEFPTSSKEQLKYSMDTLRAMDAILYASTLFDEEEIFNGLIDSPSSIAYFAERITALVSVHVDDHERNLPMIIQGLDLVLHLCAALVTDTSSARPLKIELEGKEADQNILKRFNAAVGIFLMKDDVIFRRLTDSTIMLHAGRGYAELGIIMLLTLHTSSPLRTPLFQKLMQQLALFCEQISPSLSHLFNQPTFRRLMQTDSFDSILTSSREMLQAAGTVQAVMCRMTLEPASYVCCLQWTGRINLERKYKTRVYKELCEDLQDARRIPEQLFKFGKYLYKVSECLEPKYWQVAIRTCVLTLQTCADEMLYRSHMNSLLAISTLGKDNVMGSFLQSELHMIKGVLKNYPETSQETVSRCLANLERTQLKREIDQESKVEYAPQRKPHHATMQKSTDERPPTPPPRNSNPKPQQKIAMQLKASPTAPLRTTGGFQQPSTQPLASASALQSATTSPHKNAASKLELPKTLPPPRQSSAEENASSFGHSRSTNAKTSSKSPSETTNTHDSDRRAPKKQPKDSVIDSDPSPSASPNPVVHNEAVKKRWWKLKESSGKDTKRK